jgi:hypothetical protein
MGLQVGAKHKALSLLLQKHGLPPLPPLRFKNLRPKATSRASLGMRTPASTSDTTPPNPADPSAESEESDQT